MRHPSAPTSAPPVWRPFRWFLLRATGLPFDWFGRMVETPAWAAGDEAAWAARVAEARAGLRGLVGRPLFEEAVFMCGSALDGMDWAGWLADPRRNSRARGRERALLRYAQRLCAKNDSTSFFGAVGAGRIDRVQGVEVVHPVAARRRVLVAQWVVQRLLDRAAEALRAEGGFVERPERGPGLVVDARGASAHRVGARGQLRRQDGEAGGEGVVALVERADGATAAGGGVVERLIDDGLLRSWTELPTGLEDPLAEAAARLRRQPAGPARDRWLARLGELEAMRAAFEAARYPERRALLAEMEARVAALLGEAPRRRAGRFYASRGLLIEVCGRTEEPVGLPAGWAAAAAAPLASFLDLGLLGAALERARFRAWFDARAGVGEAPWREVAAALRDDPVGFETAGGPEVEALRAAERAVRAHLRARIAEHLTAHGPEVPCVLSPEEIGPLLEPVADLLAGAGAAFANPDLMIARVHDRPVPILAECHHLPCLTPYLLPGLAQRDAIVADARALLAELCAPARPALVASYQHSLVSLADDHGEVALELSGTAARPRARRASFAELTVRRTGDGFAFTVPTYDGRRRAVVPLTRLTRLDRAAAAFPVVPPDVDAWLRAEGGPDPLPRLCWGDLVIRRRRWRVRSDDWSAPTPRAAAARLRALCGDALPRFTFVTTGAEPKPILIDWANALSVELAVWLARRSRTLILEEMLPGPGELWLRGPDGLHTSELRTVFVRAAGQTSFQTLARLSP